MSFDLFKYAYKWPFFGKLILSHFKRSIFLFNLSNHFLEFQVVRGDKKDLLRENVVYNTKFAINID